MEDDFDLELCDREPRNGWEYERKEWLRESGRCEELHRYYDR